MKEKINLKHKLDARLTAKVKVLSPKKTFENIDERRSIVGLVNNLKFPFPIRQIKIIDFSKQAVVKKLIVGNHGHPKNSGQWEIDLVFGNKNKKYFRFRYRNRNNKKIYEKILSGGDVAIIPPGCIFAFLAILENSRLIEISNKEYNSKNYLKDLLF